MRRSERITAVGAASRWERRFPACSLRSSFIIRRAREGALGAASPPSRRDGCQVWSVPSSGHVDAEHHAVEVVGSERTRRSRISSRKMAARPSSVPTKKPSAMLSEHARLRRERGLDRRVQHRHVGLARAALHLVHEVAGERGFIGFLRGLDVALQDHATRRARREGPTTFLRCASRSAFSAASRARACAVAVCDAAGDLAASRAATRERSASTSDFC